MITRTSTTMIWYPLWYVIVSCYRQGTMNDWMICAFRTQQLKYPWSV